MGNFSLDEAKRVCIENPLIIFDFKRSRRDAIASPVGDMSDFIDRYGIYVYAGAKRLVEGQYARIKRVRHKTKAIIFEGDCLFLTLTFSDATLAATDKAKRRRLVQRYLKRCGGVYVANIDFGKVGHREHYHALVQATRVDYKPWHRYGSIYGEVVKTEQKDMMNITRYVTKFTNHALKDTTKNGVVKFDRLIYSRNTD